MSLTSHLKDPASPIGQFIRQRFAHTTNLTRAANMQLRSMATLRPGTATPGYPYSTLGIAIDYRLRYSFAITPHRYLVAWKGAMLLALRPLTSPSDVEITPDELDELSKEIGMPFASRVAQGLYPLRLITSFFASLEATLKALQPIGRQLPLEAEQTLDRYCYVLALFEEAYRSGLSALKERSPLFVPTTKQSVAELLAIPQAMWIEDLCAMSSLFCERYQELFSRPHALNPTFAGSPDVGGADADMVIDGCLIDIKATVRPSLEPEHLYQLAGYLLLDYTDRYHINTVGIYMARQGALFTWPVPGFLRQLTGEDTATLESLRQAFRAVCQTFWDTPPLADDIASHAQRELGQAFQSRVDKVQTLLARGMEREAILQAAWGVKRRNSRSYEEASSEYDFIEGFLQK